MEAPVSVADKRKFLQWFIKKNEIIQWKNLQILNYMANDFELLAHIRFVRDINVYSRSLTISDHHSQELFFRYCKHKFITIDTEKIFHDIRFNKTKTLYIKVILKDYNQNSHYAHVLEEDLDDTILHRAMKENNDLIEQLFRKSHYNYEDKKLKEALNKALDNRDYPLFIKLSNALNRLESSKKGTK